MRIRHGFVSNSSSSSFLCAVCGNVDEGYEGPSDAGMAVCENYEHTFCESHAVSTREPSHSKGEYTGEEVDFENFNEASEASYGYVPSVYCPICNFEELSLHDFLKYLELKGITRESILREVKAKYKDYDSFHKAIYE